MDTHALREAARPPTTAERISTLLSRYPDVSRDEAREILNFLQTGRYLDVHALTGNRRLDDKLDAFLNDHWNHFRVKDGKGSAVVGSAVLLLFVLWAIWAVLS